MDENNFKAQKQNETQPDLYNMYYSPRACVAEKMDVLKKPINIFLGWSNSEKWG